MSACIQFSNLSKSYGTNALFDALDLSIPSQCVTALVGESGSGKSTLLMLTNGLIDSDSGEIEVLGHALPDWELVKLRRKIGYAVQGAGLFPHMTIAENISIIAELEGWPADRIQKRRSQLFAMLNLDEQLLARYPHALSGGQQQRASLCRSMMLEPELLLLDEPFSALDPLTRRQIYKEMQAVQEAEPRSVLLVTHDMDEAVRLADYIVVLKEGRVAQQGSIDEVTRSPADDYVRSLLGQHE